MSNFINLQQAVTKGNEAEILKLLKENLDLNSNDGDTLLNLAFANDNLSQEELIDVLGVFLNRGITDINAKNALGKTILHLAVERRMRDVIDFCLRRNANTNPRNKHWNSIAHFAVEEECRKLHSASRISESLEIESSSFIDWMVSRGFDFFYKKNAQRLSPLYLANELNLQHVLLTLLKRVDDLPAAEKNRTPLLREYLESNAGDRSRGVYPKIPDPIKSSYYNSRHVYNIVKIILEKSKCIDDKVLNKALRSAIESKEKIYVIELLTQRMQSVDLHSKYELSLVETLARSFGTSLASPPSHSYNDKMAILRALILKGTHLHTYINERDGRSTLAEKLFLTHPTLRMLEILNDCRVDFSRKSSCGRNFLHLISCYGREAGMIDLIWNKVSRDVNVADPIHQTPLVTAVKCRNQFAAMELIERRANINVTDCGGRPLLVVACEGARVKVLEKLIEYGADLNYRDEHGRTLLHLYLHEKEVIELLLKNNLDVNARDDSGRTPLEFALTCWKLFRNCRKSYVLGDVEALEKLIEHGARLNYRDKDDSKTLLHFAVSDSRMVEILLKNGLDVNARDINGKTPLQVAVSDAFVNGASVFEGGQAEVWEKLIEYGADTADLDYRDKDGKTGLHHTVNNLKLTELLIKRGLNVNARDNTGKTPLHFATTDEIVKILVNSGALVDTMDRDGNTPLHDALYREECKSIDELIKSGADIWDSKVFNLALKYFKDRFNIYVPLKLRYLKRHLIKMTVVGLLDEMPNAPYGIEYELEVFIVQCKKEVELLKNFFIDDGTSLCELLRKNRNRRCAYVDSEKLKDLVNDEEIETKFRIYSALIRGCYNEAARRKPLLDSAIDIMNKISRKNMRVFCIDMIFKDLSNVDMMRFIEACGNPTINNPASAHRPKLTVVNISKLLKKEK